MNSLLKICNQYIETDTWPYFSVSRIKWKPNISIIYSIYDIPTI